MQFVKGQKVRVDNCNLYNPDYFKKNIKPFVFEITWVTWSRLGIRKLGSRNTLPYNFREDMLRPHKHLSSIFMAV